MNKLFRRVVNKVFLDGSRMAYSQAGEDLVLAYLFHKLQVDKPTYLDIGANHPTHNSNTYYFYLRGSRGVCVEPNPVLFNKFRKSRPADKVLNTGIGGADKEQAEFYVFSGDMSGLSTFSKEDAHYWQEVGMENRGKIRYEKVINVPIRSINSVMKEFGGRTPDFISIDVEGLDLEILNALDFDKYRPPAFCVETLGYDENMKEYKRDEIAAFLLTKGYSIYADTRINTIFVPSSQSDLH